MKNRSVAFVAVLSLAGGAVAAILLDRPPAPVSASAPPSEFSAERAASLLRKFAQKAHPIGSAEHDRVRDYLIAHIRSLGLTPEVQRTVGVTPLYQVSGTVENIVTRVPGTSGWHDAVMLAAHYDSVPAGPGAGDDGAGVAALLEVMRALRAGTPLKNDIIFLLTDGEENGLLGASAFVAEHPSARDVRVALNFEARGNAGDSQLFETSAGNARIVQLMADAVPHADGSSFTYEIYKRMPNDTDLTIFRRTGAAGLNFAFIEHWEAYHTPLDNPDALDPGSLQRHGNYGLKLARAFANADLAKLGSANDAVFFAVPGGLFLHYPSTSIRPLLILAIVALLATWLYALGAYQTSWRKILWAMLLHVLILLVLMLASFLFVEGVERLHARVLPAGDVAKSGPYAVSMVLVLAVIAVALYKPIARRFTWPAFFLGGAALLAILNIAAAEWFVGGTYVFTWPLLAALLGSVFAVMNRASLSVFATLALCLVSLPALALLVPLLRGFFEALGLIPIPALAIPLWILMISLIPLLETLITASPRGFLVSLFGAAVIFFAIGVKQTRYGSAHPKPESILYALDTDSQRALWASTSRRVDTWSEQYLGNASKSAKLTGFYPDWLPLKFSLHETPAIPLQPPRVNVVESTTTGDIRNLRLRVSSQRHAPVVSVEVENPVLSGWVDGHKLGQPEESRWNKKGKWAFEYANIPPEGVELRLQVKGTGPVRLAAIDRSNGLPVIPGANLMPRPADSMPQNGGDETIVRKTFTF